MRKDEKEGQERIKRRMEREEKSAEEIFKRWGGKRKKGRRE